MKKSRFTDEQIVGFLRQAEAGIGVKELCRQNGFSDASHHVNDTWSADFVMDALASGRRIKCLTVVDDFSREATQRHRPHPACTVRCGASPARRRCAASTGDPVVSQPRTLLTKNRTPIGGRSGQVITCVWPLLPAWPQWRRHQWSRPERRAPYVLWEFRSCSRCLHAVAGNRAQLPAASRRRRL